MFKSKKLFKCKNVQILKTIKEKMFIIFKRKERKIKYIKLKSEEKQAEPEILKKKHKKNLHKSEKNRTKKMKNHLQPC
jgi:hypothetical protein